MDNKLSIRNATLNDLPEIQNICLKTGASGEDATGLLRNEELLSLIYAEPYLHHDLSTCFVVCLNLEVVGYILGALDTSAFNQWMNSTWLPPLKSRYFSEPTDVSLDIALVHLLHKGVEAQPVVDQYPSHLHIDLLPSAQGQGAGRKLMNRLFEQLIKQGSIGVHLGVGAKNHKAIAFYQHLGYKTLIDDARAPILGIRFPSK